MSQLGRAVLIVAALLASLSSDARAQSRPTGVRRVWAEAGFGGARRSPGCRGCVEGTADGGLTLSGAVGVSLRQGFGIALLGRAFQQLDFEVSQSSRYVVALGQYTPPRIPPLTISAGTGWGHHRGEPAPYTNAGDGAAIAGGIALRLPPRSRVALSVTADVIQSIGGAAYRPRLISGGLSLSIASGSTSHQQAP